MNVLFVKRGKNKVPLVEDRIGLAIKIDRRVYFRRFFNVSSWIAFTDTSCISCIHVEYRRWIASCHPSLGQTSVRVFFPVGGRTIELPRGNTCFQNPMTDDTFLFSS